MRVIVFVPLVLVLVVSTGSAGTLEFGQRLCDPFQGLGVSGMDRVVRDLQPYDALQQTQVFIGYGEASGGGDVPFI